MITIRHYQAKDFDAVDAIWKVTGMGGAVRGDTPQIIARTLACGGALFLLVERVRNKETIMGTCWVTNDGRRLYLHHCGIHPDFQGKAYSRMLVKPALDMAKTLNMQIKLEVHRDNKVAKHLYQQCGFAYLGDYEVQIIRDISKL